MQNGPVSLNAHRRQREDGAEDADILDVVQQSTGEVAQRPGVGHQLDHLHGNAHADEQKVGGGQRGEENIAQAAHSSVLTHNVDDQAVA